MVVCERPGRYRRQAAILAGVNPNFRFTTNERWLMTARGRLGWAADRWLWYVTGGAAWSGSTSTTTTAPALPPRSGQPTRVNKGGWVVGIGTEYALIGGWSVKSEWLYANFGIAALRRRARLVNGCTAGCANADVKMSRVHLARRHELPLRLGELRQGQGAGRRQVLSKAHYAKAPGESPGLFVARSQVQDRSHYPLRCQRPASSGCQ